MGKKISFIMKDRGVNFYGLLGVVLTLIIGGLLILASVSMPISLEKTGGAYYFLTHQLLYGFLPGLVLGLIALWFPIKRFKKYTPYIFLVGLILVGATFIPVVGLGLKGASRWLKIGSISFQPSEFLKISFILYWAYLLSALKERAKNKELFIAFWLTTFIIGLVLLLQPDMSTLIIILGTSLGMYFISGISWKKLMSIILILMILGAVFIPLAGYRLSRLNTFLHPEQDPLSSGYQLRQQILAIGSGGLLGKGLGFSNQKFGFLPHSMSDSIFAIISEETGLIGASMVILLFVLLTWFGFKICLQNSDHFSCFLGIGVILWIDIQAIIHMGANIGLIPVSGIPLPFISYGGSALTAELIAMGFLFNVARQSKN